MSSLEWQVRICRLNPDDEPWHEWSAVNTTSTHASVKPPSVCSYQCQGHTWRGMFTNTHIHTAQLLSVETGVKTQHAFQTKTVWYFIHSPSFLFTSISFSFLKLLTMIFCYFSATVSASFKSFIYKLTFACALVLKCFQMKAFSQLIHMKTCMETGVGLISWDLSQTDFHKLNLLGNISWSSESCVSNCTCSLM